MFVITLPSNAIFSYGYKKLMCLNLLGFVFFFISFNIFSKHSKLFF